jgi:NAD(P)-dependent dehydrogenase (short-subunit alcohol dehydrogenase family)
VLQLVNLAGHLNDGASVVVTSSTATYEGAAMASVYVATKALSSRSRAAGPPRSPTASTPSSPAPSAPTSATSWPSMSARTSKPTSSAASLGRVGTPDEAAAVALFLLSDDAAYVTASQYTVDGGLTKR